MNPQERVPAPDKTLEEQENDVLLAMLLWGEARGEPLEGKFAVAQVVRNRCEKRNQTWKQVMLQPKQFSAFNSQDPNYSKLFEPLKHDAETVWHECLSAAWIVFHIPTLFPDFSKGADHYLAASLETTLPVWAKGMQQVTRIGRHIFFRS